MTRQRHCERPEGAKQSLKSWVASSAVGLLAMTALLFFSACIRLTGNAGYWHRGDNDSTPKAKQIGFDTNDYVPGAPAPGAIRDGSQ